LRYKNYAVQAQWHHVYSKWVALSVMNRLQNQSKSKTRATS